MESNTRDPSHAYFRLDTIEERVAKLGERFSRLRRDEAIVASHDEILRIEDERARAMQSFDIRVNDVKRWVNRRKAETNVADLEWAKQSADRAAARRAAADALEAAKLEERREAGREKRLQAIKDGDYAVIQRSRNAGMDEQMLMTCAMVLDSFVQMGMATAGYRKRAIDQAFTIERINEDIVAGKATR